MPDTDIEASGDATQRFKPVDPMNCRFLQLGGYCP